MRKVLTCLVLMSLLFLPACSPREVIEVTRTAAPVQEGELAGTGELDIAFADGIVTITGELNAISPLQSSPGAVSTNVYFWDAGPDARWVGLVIPAPASRVKKQGTAYITVTEEGQRSNVFENVEYSASAPLHYFFAAKAPGRTISLDIVWNNAQSETLVIDYQDTTNRPLDSLFVHVTANDFIGSHDKTRLVDLGDGAIELMPIDGKYAVQGTFTSDIIYTQPWENLIMSWNADTPPGTLVEVEARAMRADGIWAEWLSWGKWGRYRENANVTTTLKFSRMNADIYTLRGGRQEQGVAVQYRVHLVSEDSSVTPAVHLIAGSMSNTLKGKTMPRAIEASAVKQNLYIDLDVPGYSQYVRDPQFSSAICSPTSLTMVLEYHGLPRQVEEMAKAVFDRSLGSEGGYGNWCYNTAVAATYGFRSYVDYLGATDEDTMSLLRLELAAGNPVVASVRYKNSAAVASQWPVLDGAPIASTSGHLVVIRGIMEKDGVTYLIVNDSAAKSDDTVRHEYRADQFLEAWHGRVAYIIRPAATGFSGNHMPEPIEASFERTGETRTVDGVRQVELALKDSDGNLVSLSNQIRTRYLTISYTRQDGSIQYVPLTRNDTIWVDASEASRGYVVNAFFTDGRIYKATLK